MKSTACPPGARNWDHLRGVMLVGLAATFWSLGGLLVRLLEHAQAWQIVFYRSLALTVTLTVVILWRRRGDAVAVFRRTGLIASLAGFCLSLGFVGWIFALTHTTVANALFLLTTQPFFTAILALLLLGEEVVRVTWLALGLALIGVGVMMSDGLAVGTLFGNLMGLGSAVCFSGFTVALRWGREMDMLPAVWWGGGFAVLLSGAVLLVGGQPLRLGGWDLGLCLILGVVQIGFGLMAYTAGSRYLPAAELALLALLEVLLGPLWVWLGVGELPSRLTLAGGVIVLIAVVWRTAYGRRRAPAIGVM